jgi:hypothetical protein
MSLVALATLLATTLAVPAPTYAQGQVITVTTTKDLFGANVTDGCGTAPAPYQGECSLRQAINDANRSTQDVTIVFNIEAFVRSNPEELEPGFNGNSWTISPTVALPPLENAQNRRMILDGSTQQSFSGSDIPWPIVIIDGTAVDNQPGLRLISNGITINGIAVTNFQGNPASSGTADRLGVGIEVRSNNNTIVGSFVGVDSASLPFKAAPNDAAGIWINGGNNNRVGAPSGTVIPGIRVMPSTTTIAGNLGDGVLITGATALSNTIQASYIGITPISGSAIPNGANGVHVNGVNGLNTIGTSANATDLAGRNVISNSGERGILLTDSSNVNISGNLIGLSAQNSLVTHPNGSDGIAILSVAAPSTNNIIGGNNPNVRNQIAANKGAGVLIRGVGATGNRVTNTTIGLDRLNRIPVGVNPNQTAGVRIEQNASGNIIGGAIAANGVGLANIIAGNSGPAVVIVANRALSGRADGNIVSGNFIGTNALGDTRGNLGDGIVINELPGSRTDTMVNNTQIGGTTDSTRNVIAFNQGRGIHLSNAGIRSTSIGKNLIRNNTLGGMVVNGAGETQMAGGTGLRAEISNNGGVGLLVTGGVTTTLDAYTINGHTAGVDVSGGNTTLSSVIIRDNQRSATFNTGNRVTINNTSILSNAVGLIVTDTARLIFNTININFNRSDAARITRAANLSLTAGTLNDNLGRGLVLSEVQTSTLSTLNANRNGGTAVEVTTGTGFAIATGNLGANNGRGVSVTNIQNVDLSRVQANTNQGIGLFLDQTPRVRLSTVTANDNRDSGLVVNATTSLNLSNSTLSRNAGDGVRVNNGRNLTMASNTITNNTGDGLRLNDGSRDAQANGNNISSNGQNGVRVTGGQGVVLSGSFVNTNAQHGFLVESLARNITVNSTSIFSNSLSGITVSGTGSPGTAPITILDNRISGNGLPAGGPLPVPIVGNGKGIVLESQGLGSQSPNNDIDPPFELRLSQQGLLSGRVSNTAGDPNACLPVTNCRIQVFTSNTQTLDAQGLNKIGDLSPGNDGRFTLQIGRVVPQITLTATDGAGNTSSFSFFTSKIGPLLLFPKSPLLAGQLEQTAAPGQQISFTATISNGGNVDFTDIDLSANSLLGWDALSTSPADPVTVIAGEQKDVTLSITLPTGSDRRVIAGLRGVTTLTARSTSLPFQTATISTTTNVAGKFLLNVSPPLLAQGGLPGQTVAYTHTVTNNGNITTTVTLAAPITTINGLPAPIWTAQIIPAAVTLNPGESRPVRLEVTVPAGAQLNTTANTAVRVTSPDPTQSGVFTSTTTVGLVQRASLVLPTNRDAAIGDTVTIEHIVTNQSNGPATFCLNGSSGLGSTLRFISNTPGIPFDNNNCFTLGTGAANSTFSFFVEVQLNPAIRTGQNDTVVITLTDGNGRRIEGASVVDTIRVVRGRTILSYLPLILR